jgi:hypothetical protein
MKLPQLSLRELFLLVVIAAMGCGWWVDRQKLSVDAKHWRDAAEAFELIKIKDELDSSPPLGIYWQKQDGTLMKLPLP